MTEVLVEVSPAMVAAGLDRLQDLVGEEDRTFLVQAIYLAMEYQRLMEAGK